MRRRSITNRVQYHAFSNGTVHHLGDGEFQPSLDEVLKYVLAANRQFHLPPSIYHRADLFTEENRVSLVKYALTVRRRVRSGRTGGHGP